MQGDTAEWNRINQWQVMINVVPCTNRNCAAQNTDLGPERIPVFSEMSETAREGQNNILNAVKQVSRPDICDESGVGRAELSLPLLETVQRSFMAELDISFSLFVLKLAVFLLFTVA